MKLEKLEKIVFNTLKPRSHLGIEVTATQQCNCRCKYCFESFSLECQESKRDSEEETRQLNLIKDFCQKFDILENESLSITFWGGEPLLNLKFVEKIISATIEHDFVNYYMFTNGTLIDNIQHLLERFSARRLKHKIHFQLSYDGEPHNRFKRGELSSSRVLEAARLLKMHEIPFSFKATLSFDMLQELPRMWKSYEQLYKEFGECARYSPTLDMLESTPSQNDLDSWLSTLLEVAKLERRFIERHGQPLMKCFDYGSKRVCNPTKSVMMHVDGKFYLCHGCAYLRQKQDFQLEDTKSTQSLEEVFKKMDSIVAFDARNDDCTHCPAVWCTACHINHVDPNNLHDDWIQCISRAKMRCQYMKIFGLVARVLSLACGVNINDQRELR